MVDFNLFILQMEDIILKDTMEEQELIHKIISKDQIHTCLQVQVLIKINILNNHMHLLQHLYNIQILICPLNPKCILLNQDILQMYIFLSQQHIINLHLFKEQIHICLHLQHQYPTSISESSNVPSSTSCIYAS